MEDKGHTGRRAQHMRVSDPWIVTVTIGHAGIFHRNHHDMADSEGDQRPAKRPRTLASNNPNNSCTLASPGFAKNIERDSEFWLEDGNVVLVAQNTGFRVYKGLLAAQSPVFHDMFSAAGLQADERYDGVPVVPLFDSPVDLRHLLRVLLPKTQKE